MTRYQMTTSGPEDTASYEVDTFSSFRSRVNGERKRNLMRAHYTNGNTTETIVR